MVDFRDARILIIDDEPDALELFERQLKDYYNVTAVHTAERVFELLEKELFHIVLTDVVMPDITGIELLETIKEKYSHVSVVLISGKASVDMAVKAMKLGAEDFIEKPILDMDLLHMKVEKILTQKWQSSEIERLKDMLSSELDIENFVGNSYTIQKLLEKVRLIAPLDTTVLIMGETGVGKEVFANLLYKNSNRRDRKFVTVNCGAMPENLLESMLFGHKKGAFTSADRDKIGYFQEADGGTLFLDEITETSREFQIKLLRVLEQGTIRQVGGDEDIKVDVRIVAATNRELETEVAKKTFREDLYYRLNIMSLHIPPLRERKEDIELLACEFVRKFSQKYNKDYLTLPEPVIDALTGYKWKGNVRELRNVIEHAVVMATHNTINVEDLPFYRKYNREKRKMEIEELFKLPVKDAKNEFEKHYLFFKLKQYSGDIVSVVEATGIKRQNLYEKFKKYGIDINLFR